MKFTEKQKQTFWSKVDKSGSCWLYQGLRNRWGYGRHRVSERNWQAHRLAWFLANGPIPKGLHILHQCDNRLCCNPSHLSPGTQKDNVQDCLSKGRHAHGSMVPGPRKLTERAVLELRAMTNRPKLRVLAARYGVSITTIHSAINGKSWAWAGKEPDIWQGRVEAGRAQR